LILRCGAGRGQSIIVCGGNQQVAAIAKAARARVAPDPRGYGQWNAVFVAAGAARSGVVSTLLS
jgi:hypothetical protein